MHARHPLNALHLSAASGPSPTKLGLDLSLSLCLGHGLIVGKVAGKTGGSRLRNRSERKSLSRQAKSSLGELLQAIHVAATTLRSLNAWKLRGLVTLHAGKNHTLLRCKRHGGTASGVGWDESWLLTRAEEHGRLYELLHINQYVVANRFLGKVRTC